MSEIYTTIPSEVESTSGTVTYASYAVAGLDSTTYATVTATALSSTGSYVSASSYLYLGFDLSSIPSDAVIDALSCQVKWGKSSSYSGTGSSNYYTYLYLRKKTTATSLASTNNTAQNVGATTTKLTVTSTDYIGKTIADIDSYLRLCMRSYARAAARSTKYTRTTTVNTQVYGAELTIEYTLAGVKYKVKINGEWKDGTVYGKDDAWNGAKESWVKVDGLWKQIT